MGTSSRHKSTGLILLAAGLLILEGASSAAGPRGKGTAFDGSCSIQGSVKFDPGATYTAQPLHYDFTGKGTCTGTLDGNAVKDVAVGVHQYGQADGTCASAHTTELGTGKMAFPDADVLRYTLEFTYSVPETDFSFNGSRSGHAHGKGTFQTDRTPPDTLARCATPTGAGEVPMDITLTTDSLLVSRKS